MPAIIYLDVLFVINLYVNYILLLSTAKFTHKQPRRLRLLLSSIVGSLFCVLILFETISYFVITILKFLLALLLVWIAFGYHGPSIYIKTVGAFFGVNFIFGGLMFAIWIFIKPTGMYYNNSVVYFDINAQTLVISTIIAYLLINLLCYILDKRVGANKIHLAEIEMNGRKVLVHGFIDTGNNLRETFSGSPVIICEHTAVESLLPTEIYQAVVQKDMTFLGTMTNSLWKSRIRIIPYDVVGGNGLLITFKPDQFYIIKKDKKVKKEVYIGITTQKLSQGEYDTILNEKVLV